MKTHKFSLDSHYWTQDDVECPYQLIWLLKHLASVSYYRKQLRYYCCYTLSHTMYDKESVSDVLYDTVVLQSLFKAAYRIYLNPSEFKKMNLMVSDVTRQELMELEYLNEEEFKNPYLVFETVFDCFSLDRVCKSIFDLVMSAMSETDFGKDYSCSISMVNFFKMLEAIELIQKRDANSYS